MARERMSGVDTAWLRMDSPGNLMMIVGVEVLDTPLAYDELSARLRERFLKYDRFRQRVESDATGYWWVDDPDFRLDRHLQRIKLRGGGGDAQLKELAGKLASEPLDPAHPLWQFHLIEHFRGGSALIARIHHCIADGIALVGVMMSLTDGAPGVQRTSSARSAASRDRADEDNGFDLGGVIGGMIEPLTRGANWAADAAGTAIAGSFGIASDPQARAAVASVGTRVISDALKIALLTEDSPTRLKGKPSGRKVVAWNDPLPLDEVKAVCKVLGVSVNDVLLSGVAGALHRYLEDLGERTAGKEIRAMVPVNLRAANDPPSLGNRFGLVPLTLPVGISNPVERLYEVRRRMNELKEGYQGPLAFALLSVIGYVPRQVQSLVLEYLARKGTAVITNVPGPREAILISGAKLSRMMFWVPQSGDIGVGVSILSYDGGVQFGLITDAALCPDPQSIVDRFAPEFEQLVLALSMLPRELVASGALDAREVEQWVLGGPPGGPPNRRPRSRSTPRASKKGKPGVRARGRARKQAAQ